MKENKKTPIIYGKRIAWARYDYTSPRTGKKHTCLVQLWERNDGTTRLYCGTHRMSDVYTFRWVCEFLDLYGWKLVQGGC